MSGYRTDLARECVYRFLSVALTDPCDNDWSRLLDGENQRLAAASIDLLRGQSRDLAEAARAALTLDPLFEQLDQPLEAFGLEHQRVFGLTPARECPPFEVEYQTNTEPFFQSQQLADIAGFYRAFGLNPSATKAVRPDHLALELEFMAFVLMKRRQLARSRKGDPDPSVSLEVCDQAAADFFREHIAWWAPAFATGLARRAESGFYAELGKVLSAFVNSECSRFGISTTRIPLTVSPPPPAEEPMECAACPGL